MRWNLANILLDNMAGSQNQRLKLLYLMKILLEKTDSAQAKQLKRQVFMADRAKTINETVYYSIDQIHNDNSLANVVLDHFDKDVFMKALQKHRCVLQYVCGGVFVCAQILLLIMIS